MSNIINPAETLIKTLVAAVAALWQRQQEMDLSSLLAAYPGLRTLHEAFGGFPDPATGLDVIADEKGKIWVTVNGKRWPVSDFAHWIPPGLIREAAFAFVERLRLGNAGRPTYAEAIAAIAPELYKRLPRI